MTDSQIVMTDEYRSAYLAAKIDCRIETPDLYIASYVLEENGKPRIFGCMAPVVEHALTQVAMAVAKHKLRASGKLSS